MEILASIGALAAVIFGAFLAGRRSQRKQDTTDDLKRDRATLERINNATAKPRSADDIDKRLRDLSK